MAPKKKSPTETSQAEATQVSQQEQETASTTTTTTGPTAPHNQAAAVAEQHQINKHRLTRFTRPFQPGKKGGPQQVAPRVWRDETSASANTSSEENGIINNQIAVTEDGEQQQQNQNNKASSSLNNNNSNSNNRTLLTLITKDLVEELTSKLGPIDLQRAAAKQDPIPIISTEAANIRAKRFHTETPQEIAAKRESRFEALAAANGSNGTTLLLSSSSSSLAIPTVDADAASKREARWGVTLSQPAKAPIGNNAAVIKNNDQVVAKVALTEAEKKRLDRFK